MDNTADSLTNKQSNIGFGIKVGKEYRKNIVDNLELATLLLPNLSRYRLANVAEALELDWEAIQTEWVSLKLDSNIGEYAISEETLHNAVTDVYLLYRVYQRLLKMLDGDDPISNLLQTILPELFAPDTSYNGVDETHIELFRTRCDWRMHPTQTVSPAEIPPAGQILSGYLDAKSYQPRRGQLEMQQHLTDALTDDHFAMVEAPTGTGKTLAYLAAAVHQSLTEGRRVALSTAYRNLQDQLLTEIGDLQQYGPVSFRSQLLKGVGNYLCWSQIARHL